jgi:hypothetical protein
MWHTINVQESIIENGLTMVNSLRFSFNIVHSG